MYRILRLRRIPRGKEFVKTRTTHMPHVIALNSWQKKTNRPQAVGFFKRKT